MAQPQSWRVHPTTSYRRKKIVSKPLANPITKQTQDKLVTSHDTVNIMIEEVKEDDPHVIDGEPTDLSTLKSFKTYVANFVSNKE